MSVQVRIEYNHLPATIRTVANRGDNCAKNIAQGVARDARAKAPVLTGNLKHSIHVEHTGHNQYSAIADTKHNNPTARAYAHYVERGTRYMRAQPYMFPGYITARATTLPYQIALYVRFIEAAARTGRTF